MDQETLLKLCWMLNQVQQAERAYNRAQWKTSYYRKLKAKLANSKKTSEKWSEQTELTKKIEACRLNALRKQEERLKVAKKYAGRMAAAALKLEAIYKYANGEVVGMSIPTRSPSQRTNLTWRYIDQVQIEEMADQYEAEKAFTRILTTKGKD